MVNDMERSVGSMGLSFGVWVCASFVMGSREAGTQA